MLIQSLDQIIDVKHWPFDEDWFIYPEGARDKRLYYAPNNVRYHFCQPKHKYLFKCSSPRYKEQFWVEIFCYYLGKLLDIPVPPTFVAIDSKLNQTGSLIEWFHLEEEVYVPGGDIMQYEIANYDRKKGTQHNMQTIMHVLEEYYKAGLLVHDWRNMWAKILLFDALIGNTDRHQDNWGLIFRGFQGQTRYVRLTPVFDNGTSLGHEVHPLKLNLFDKKRLHTYIMRGKHHLKWSKEDKTGNPHADLCQAFCAHLPRTKPVMQYLLDKLNFRDVENILHTLTLYNVPQPLTLERATFMLKLLKARHAHLQAALEHQYEPN